ncbi:MAG TPA: UDP-3-O-(3-hydroxymyristoyl)glucosamine N-acyltransferase [Pyrinomonadaceae bacterium]|nr:UDP-3-O-(3-hydroxymyristoyl)glucosamine N-acyltransferase [Pyrinomonadaceae bacterium]
MKTREIAEFLSGELHGDSEIEITRVAAIDSAGKGDISFLENPSTFSGTAASCLIVPSDFEASSAKVTVKVENPKLGFALIAERLHPSKSRTPQIHESALISPEAKIGNDVFIGAFACVGDGSRIGNRTQLRAGAKVGDGVTIGENCVLHPNVFVEDGCTIGDNVVLHSGVVIGADGFGYVRDVDRYVKFPQIGTVVIEDNVEIGANTCVDRGALGETRIGEGTKIDNLVQVGHNVQIGRRCVIAAQTGISGSTVIEDDCVIGGQVGFGDHARVQSGAVIGSQAGVLPGKIVRPGVWWGTPIQPLDEYKRQNAHVKGLARLKNEVAELKRKLNISSDD